MHVIATSSFAKGLERFDWRPYGPNNDKGGDDVNQKSNYDQGVIINVCGGIGVGKSRLCKDASQRGFFALEETILPHLLSDYIHRQAELAFPLQLTMMQNACARSQTARNFLSWLSSSLSSSSGITSKTYSSLYQDPERCTLVERPAVENVIFALANYLTGKLSISDFGKYLEYIHEHVSLEENHTMSTTVSSTLGKQHLPTNPLRPISEFILLWAPEEIAYENMLKRARQGEADYSRNVYLEGLNHAYFMEVAMNPAFFVIDWQNYGTYDELAQVLTKWHQEERPSTGIIRRPIPLPTISSIVSTDSLADAIEPPGIFDMDLGDEGEEPHLILTMKKPTELDEICHYVTRNSLFVMYFNLAQYLDADVDLRRRARTAFFQHIAIQLPSAQTPEVEPHLVILEYPSNLADRVLADRTYLPS